MITYGGSLRKDLFKTTLVLNKPFNYIHQRIGNLCGDRCQGSADSVSKRDQRICYIPTKIVSKRLKQLAAPSAKRQRPQYKEKLRFGGGYVFHTNRLRAFQSHFFCHFENHIGQ